MCIRDRADAAEFSEVNEQTRIFAAGLVNPFCGANAGFEAAEWFGEAGSHVRSLALVPLRREAETIGLLAPGSAGGQRFSPELGTLYLGHTGDCLLSPPDDDGGGMLAQAAQGGGHLRPRTPPHGIIGAAEGPAVGRVREPPPCGGGRPPSPRP